MEKKCINVFYKDVMRKISYFGSFNEKTVKSTIRTLYHIKEPIEQIFFTDENGDIIILEGNGVPNELKVHLYIEFDSIPKNPETELNIAKCNDTSNLLKFHWVFSDKTINSNDWIGVISQNKYTYQAISIDKCNPVVESSVIFTKGKYFFVLRKGVINFYSALCVINSDYEYKPHISIYNSTEYIGIKNRDVVGNTQNLGVLIDLVDKKLNFYDYEKKKLLESFDLYYDNVKFVGWLKGKSSYGGNGFTILNEGCIPIPDWI